MLKIGLKPEPLAEFAPKLLLAMDMVVPNAGEFSVPFSEPKLG